jgi:hypothetical protein
MRRRPSCRTHKNSGAHLVSDPEQNQGREDLKKAGLLQLPIGWQYVRHDRAD